MTMTQSFAIAAEAGGSFGGPAATESDDNFQREARVRKVLSDLRVVFRAIQSYSKMVERQCQVSATMLWVLREIAAAGELKISEVARILSIHQSTASNLLDKLERRGLVRRQRGSRQEDQRVVLVTLTSTGLDLLDQAGTLHHGPLTEALDQMAAEDLVLLNQSLDKLVQAIPAGKLDHGLMPPITE
ncbi:MarR family winged helix-turn-helix transcriptional regulator [Desulfurivibrio dismutans]|uniref:MarR family winged helix-turn-helix transcriptional regulator n=1 Tax=Desulfurivibrio dismutans TaxID=1398908 RepID=UPI0023DCB2EE|nr:MarR family transcriptional regulator [Desulfurivibrio alkaliphilus]MDF1614316.1 MarR family transcriptional regulator [Desulfurivibrio alkaliphilus]